MKNKTSFLAAWVILFILVSPTTGLPVARKKKAVALPDKNCKKWFYYDSEDSLCRPCVPCRAPISLTSINPQCSIPARCDDRNEQLPLACKPLMDREGVDCDWNVILGSTCVISQSGCRGEVTCQGSRVTVDVGHIISTYWNGTGMACLPSELQIPQTTLLLHAPKPFTDPPDLHRNDVTSHPGPSAGHTRSTGAGKRKKTTAWHTSFGSGESTSAPDYSTDSTHSSDMTTTTQQPSAFADVAFATFLSCVAFGLATLVIVVYGAKIMKKCCLSYRKNPLESVPRHEAGRRHSLGQPLVRVSLDGFPSEGIPSAPESERHEDDDAAVNEEKRLLPSLSLESSDGLQGEHQKERRESIRNVTKTSQLHTGSADTGEQAMSLRRANQVDSNEVAVVSRANYGHGNDAAISLPRASQEFGSDGEDGDQHRVNHLSLREDEENSVTLQSDTIYPINSETTDANVSSVAWCATSQVNAPIAVNNAAISSESSYSQQEMSRPDDVRETGNVSVKEHRRSIHGIASDDATTSVKTYAVTVSDGTSVTPGSDVHNSQSDLTELKVVVEHLRTATEQDDYSVLPVASLSLVSMSPGTSRRAHNDLPLPLQAVDSYKNHSS